eukprot:TRINITY_DN3405_c1_g1_i1.p1 TRINITY_DN3405_c1_g1~~TRINITY_DN3405_c1_g1_i1.p1  ORF type:complete len:427 (-),score=128.08 TRINITY_DN3405_c1_g1_i1:853-1950(-)
MNNQLEEISGHKRKAQEFKSLESDIGKENLVLSPPRSLSSRRRSEPLTICYEEEEKSPRRSPRNMRQKELSFKKEEKFEVKKEKEVKEESKEDLKTFLAAFKREPVSHEESYKEFSAKAGGYTPKKKGIYKKVALSNAKKEAPEGWKEVWDLIWDMRKERNAPVDSMGSASLADRTADPKSYRYQTLLSLLLSSQTKDQVTGQAMANLKEHGCTIDNILATDVNVIDSLISKVGFHQRKAIYIKETTKVLKEKYDGDIPDNIEGLLELPGIGPKMGFIILDVAWGKTIGIGVDVHVHRICNRLKWVNNTKNPEETRKDLESWLPSEYWNQINLLLVGFGQQICTPLRPKCSGCKANQLCPSAFKA